MLAIMRIETFTKEIDMGKKMPKPPKPKKPKKPRK
jgi:hypothetical protein